MKIDRFAWGCLFIAALSLIGFIGTDSMPLFLVSAAFAVTGVATMMIVDTRRRLQLVKEATTLFETNTLMTEIYVYLIEYWAARQGVFLCPRCCKTSYNPNDAREGYCGACHDFTGTNFSDLPGFNS